MINPYPVIQHTLDLKRNAIDSLNEALAKIERTDQGELRELKFSILHFTHFLELLLKFRISLINEILIYDGAFLDNPRKEKTITLTESLNFLTNSNNINQDFGNDIRKIKRIRNNIEHYNVDINTHDARLLIARLASKACAFFNSINDEPIELLIDADKRQILENLSDQNGIATLEAESRAREAAAGTETVDCSACGGRSTAANVKGGRKCFLCSFLDAEFKCFFCHGSWYKSNCLPLGKNSKGIEQLACEKCAFSVNGGDPGMVEKFRKLPERYEIYISGQS